MKVDVRNSHSLYNGYIKLDKAEVSYEKFDGTMSEYYERLCVTRKDAAAAVVYNTESNKLVFVEQFRFSAHRRNGGGGRIVELVAGTCEGEDPYDCIVRELQEEAGYANPHYISKITEFMSSPGVSTETISLYYFEVSNSNKTSPGGGLASEGEDIRVLECHPHELHKLNIVDAKTLLGVLWWQHHQAATII